MNDKLQAKPVDEKLASLISTFCGASKLYYQRRLPAFFGNGDGTISINKAALIGGPIWAAARGLFGAFLIVVALELILVAVVATGAAGRLGERELARANDLGIRAEARAAQATEAEATGAENAKQIRAAATALALSAKGAAEDVRNRHNQDRNLVLAGIAAFVALRVFFATIANFLYARHFEQWRAGNKSVRQGLDVRRGLGAGAVFLFLGVLVALQFRTESPPGWLATISGPTIASTSGATRLDNAFHYLTTIIEPVSVTITVAIESIAATLEYLFTASPWPVTATLATALAMLLAGYRVAIFTAVGLAYLIIFGFWDRSMSTVALLGTAALLSLAVGLPLGIIAGKRPVVYGVVRPVLDLMQTMPAFVYLIPIIAIFGTGKTPSILATFIFGMPPAVRFTALGLQQVPTSIREACTAFGATEWQTLWKAELPLAMPSIKAGINQTILLCLSMVVVASLIGAGGLGEIVLESLQYASTGQGILVGIAILICAIILDRIVQGRPPKDTR